ncbi:MAG: hypothetical protein VKI93_08530 [Synechococcus sp.]|nr:hypothetical protein [Synechococcus sp.]
MHQRASQAVFPSGGAAFLFGVISLDQTVIAHPDPSVQTQQHDERTKTTSEKTLHKPHSNENLFRDEISDWIFSKQITFPAALNDAPPSQSVRRNEGQSGKY